MAKPNYIQFVNSELFKIILTAPTCEIEPSPKPPENDSLKLMSVTFGSFANATVTATTSGLPFYIHKALLASLSPELDKHTSNEMKEGKENTMVLHNVDALTMTRFIEWAYTNEYPESCEPKNVKKFSASNAIVHAKLHVFGDRFNITDLKRLAYKRLVAVLEGIDPGTRFVENQSLMQMVKYCYQNMPFRSPIVLRSSPTIVREDENNLLRYLACYVACFLEEFRANEEFESLLEANIDFAKAIISCCRPATSTFISSTKPATPKVMMGTKSSKILLRICNACGYQGIAWISCRYCNRSDGEVGLEVTVGGTTVILGEERIRGTSQAAIYTCRWCSQVRSYGVTEVYCRRCNGKSLREVK